MAWPLSLKNIPVFATKRPHSRTVSLSPPGKGSANGLASIGKPLSPPSRFPHRLHPIAHSALIPHGLRFISASALIPLSPPLDWRLRPMAGIAHAALVSRSSPPSPASALCFSPRSSFACSSLHRHRVPESVDELTNPYNLRKHSILGPPSSIEVTFPIGRSLRFK
jgi:hypothetical protein